MRFAAPLDGVTVVDLMFASCGIEGEIVAAATAVTLHGTEIPVARGGHLVAMKLLSRDDRARPQDAADLVALRARLAPAEVEVARTACRLIVERNANRGRDLMAALDAWHADR